MIARLKPRRRTANATVQFAVVAAVFIMILFGIIEYSRFIFFRGVVINASREGARYAVVNLDDTTVVTDTQAKVKTMMFNVDSKLTGYTCNVYWSNSSGTNIGAAGDATFGAYVAVEVYGTYSPILPSLLKMNTTYTIKARTIMCSEAN